MKHMKKQLRLLCKTHLHPQLFGTQGRSVLLGLSSGPKFKMKHATAC